MPLKFVNETQQKVKVYIIAKLIVYLKKTAFGCVEAAITQTLLQTEFLLYGLDLMVFHGW